jgi:hypothetical protein
VGVEEEVEIGAMKVCVIVVGTPFEVDMEVIIEVWKSD